MTEAFAATTVDEDFGVNRGSSYTYTRTVHLGPHTVQVRVKRSLRPDDSWAVAEILSADLTWTALAHSHSDHWFEHTDEPYGVNAKAELNEIADDLIQRVTAIMPSSTSVPQRSLDMMGTLLALACGDTGECVITPDEVRWAKEHGGPFRIVPLPGGSVLLSKAHRYDCPFLVTAGTEACDGSCQPGQSAPIPEAGSPQ